MAGPTKALIPESAHNYSVGRHGQKVRAVVIHIMEGTLTGTDSWFRSPASDVSAHYGIGRDGRILQWVEEENSAWHAGKVIRPTAKIVEEMGAVNPNSYTIGIEHEGRATEEPTHEQMVASATLVDQILTRYGLPLSADTVIPHRAIRADKTCPGKINTGTLISMIAEMRQQRMEGVVVDLSTPEKRLTDLERRYAALEERVSLLEKKP